MTTSPYDSLPMGNNDTMAEATPTTETDTMEYVEVDLEQLQAMADEPVTEHPRKVTEEISQTTESAPISTPAPSTINTPATKPAPARPSIPPTKPASPAKTIPFESAPQYTRLNVRNLCGKYEYMLPFEESLLVPDTMPDMQKVLFAEGRVDPAQPNKLSYDKNDFLAGNITVYTVYAPAPSKPASPAAGPAAFTDSPIDVVKSTIPFKTDKCWEAAEGDNFRVSLSVKNLTAEMINERKFIVRGEIYIKMTGIGHKELKIFKSAGDEQLVTAAGTVKATDLAHETTETTEISQDMTIRDGMPSPIKILKETINISEAHRQVTSGKLVINGSIHSQILYLGETDDGDKKTACLSGKTDFTQFIVMDNDADPDLMNIRFVSGDLKVTIENKDKLHLQGNVLTHIQVYESKELATTTDAYHKSGEICFDKVTRDLTKISGTVNGEISAREVVDLSETNNRPVELLCGSCHITSIKGQHEKNRIIIEGSMPVKLLALDDDEKPFIIDHTVPIRGSLEMPAAEDSGISALNTNSISSEPIQISIDATVKEFWFDEINSRQIEINTSLAITVWTFSKETFCTLENLCFAETGESARRISMAVYVVGRGDTLWDVAKRYKTDMDVLADLNEIDASKPLPEGVKLFISK